MRAELTLLADELRALLPGTQPFVLPMPYTRGHFRIFSQEDLPKTPDFTAVRRGGNLFVTVSPERLCRALVQADKTAAELTVRPQDSALDTLLYQILRKNWQPAPDEPLLMRLALELDDDAARCRNVLNRMEELLPKAYAQALRENRQSSALTAVARQAVHYRNLHHL